MLKSFKKRFGASSDASPKDKRREPHEEVEDGTVAINGQAYRVIDWSARAFMAKPCDIDCKIFDLVDIKFSIRFPTKRIEFVSRALVVRIDKERQELAAYFAELDEEAQIAIANHFGDGSMTKVAATASPPATPHLRLVWSRGGGLGAGPTKIDLEHLTAAETRLEQEVVGDEIDKVDADQRVVAAPAAQSVPARAPDQTVDTGPATTTLLGQPRSSIVATGRADSIDVGEELMNDRTEEIKRRAAEIAAETAEIKEDMRSAMIELGRQNLAAFREKIDDAGVMQILGENPQIKVQDHSHAFAFRLGRAEFAVFADWDNGQLCREVVGVEEGTRRPRTTDFDHDEALNDIIYTLARMLAALQIGADEGQAPTGQAAIKTSAHSPTMPSARTS